MLLFLDRPLSGGVSGACPNSLACMYDFRPSEASPDLAGVRRLRPGSISLQFACADAEIMGLIARGAHLAVCRDPGVVLLRIRVVGP